MGASQSKEEKLKQYLENQVLNSMYPPPSASLIKTRCRKPIKSKLQNIRTIMLDATPIGRNLEAIINNPDLRQQVINTDKWPNSVHGVVSYQFKDAAGKCWGTGTLIGPNIVLTAGHNLYDHPSEAYVELESMRFLPGINGQILPFGQVKVKQYFVSPEYVKEDKEDYGLLILEEPIGEMTGYFGLACLEPEEIKKKKINVTGYPGDKVAQKPRMYEMWGMEGSVSTIDVTKGQIHYMIDTGQGQSGSGVWYQEGEDYYICGVHVSAGPIVNTATLLTRRNYQQIHSWIKQAAVEGHLVLLEETKELNFKDFEFDLECISLLSQYNLKNLIRLDLSYQQLDCEQTKTLGQNTSWINLQHLYLQNNNIGAEGVKVLAQNFSWINLQYLDLQNNNIGAEGVKALAQNFSWINLQYLDLQNNNIRAEGAKAIAQNISWTNLQHLYLACNNVGAEGAKALAQNISWTNLQHLNLWDNKIGTKGAKALAQNISWTNLQHLNLACNNIGPEGAKELSENRKWKSLTNQGIFL